MLELSSFYYVPIPTFPNMVVLFAVSLIALYVYLWHLREHWLRIRNLNGEYPNAPGCPTSLLTHPDVRFPPRS